MPHTSVVTFANKASRHAGCTCSLHQSSKSIGTCLPLHAVLQHGHVQARSCLFVPSIACCRSVFAILPTSKAWHYQYEYHAEPTPAEFDPPEASE